MAPSSPPISVTTGILVGGRSRRMGRPKAGLMTPTGRTWLGHVIEQVRPISRRIVLVGALPDVPSDCAGWPRIADAPYAAGPLAGLCALLEYAATPWILLVACDLPRLTRAVPAALVSAAAPGAAAVCFSRPGGVEPCCALYHASIAPTVRALATATPSAGLHRVIAGLPAVRVLAPSAAERRALTNVNTPADLAPALDADAP